MSIGTNIKQFREERGLTQEQVADKLGISQSYISRLEKRIIARLRDELTAQETAAAGEETGGTPSS